jgi:hypothetical protein
LIPFSKAKDICLAESHGKIVETHGVGAMSEMSVRKWCRYFKQGRVNVRDKE